MTATPAAEPQPSIWEDLLEIFYAPSRVFARRSGKDIAIPFLVLIGLSIILYYATADLFRPIMDAELQRRMADVARQNPNMTAEQLEQGMAIGRKMAGFFGMIGLAILPWLVGFFLWLVGKIVGSVADLGSAMMIAVFAMYPRLLQYAASAVQAAILPEEKLTGQLSVSIGPGRFLDPDTAGALLTGLMARLDLFTLWGTVLLAIGIKVKGKVSTGQAVVVGVLIWLLGGLPLVLGALRG
ncbi:MAG: YIP1 family protein [Gemmatimonadales bacterium]